MDGERRSATVSWHRPQEAAALTSALDGLSYVRKVRDRELPAEPLMEALGFRVIEVQEGRVVLGGQPEELHLNLGGVVHGGYLSTMIDCATSYALHTMLAAGRTAPPVSASYSFLRVGLEGVALRCEALVGRSGSRIGHVRAEVTDMDGRVLATGETTHVQVSTDDDRRMQPGPSA
ncbi:MAG: PaaI family thioesterase [Baekduia sp.]